MLLIDTRELKKLEKQLAKVPREAKNEVRKSNRKWAGELRNRIRAVAPRTGLTRKRQGRAHDTRAGAIKRSIRSRVGTDWALVGGGGTRAPHFNVHEFGGAVWWSKGGKLQSAARQRSHRSALQMRERFGGDIGHIIPVKGRGAQMPARTAMTHGLNYGGGGVQGYFFTPTVDKNLPEIQRGAADGAADAIRRTLRGG